MLFAILALIAFIIISENYRTNSESNFDSINSLPIVKPCMVCDIFSNDINIAKDGNRWHKVKDGSWGCSKTPMMRFVQMKYPVVINYIAKGDQYSVREINLIVTANESENQFDESVNLTAQSQMINYANTIYRLLFNKEVDSKVRDAISGKIKSVLKEEVSLHSAHFYSKSLVKVETENKPNIHEIRLIITKSN
ncbi:MAG: hypothetical protein ACO201_03620 [Rickettsiales bacterium]